MMLCPDFEPKFCNNDKDIEKCEKCRHYDDCCRCECDVCIYSGYCPNER